MRRAVQYPFNLVTGGNSSDVVAAAMRVPGVELARFEWAGGGEALLVVTVPPWEQPPDVESRVVDNICKGQIHTPGRVRVTVLARPGGDEGDAEEASLRLGGPRWHS